jgi:hypothetical protein
MRCLPSHWLFLFFKMIKTTNQYWFNHEAMPPQFLSMAWPFWVRSVYWQWCSPSRLGVTELMVEVSWKMLRCWNKDTKMRSMR